MKAKPGMSQVQTRNNQSETHFIDESGFNRAVVAAAFSPRLTAVLNEAYRIVKLFNSWPIIGHAGEESAENRLRLEEAVDRSLFAAHPPICVIEHGNPVEVLLKVVHHYHADLLIAGALAKEGLFKYYLGSTARSLARNAPCSVLLFTEPQVKTLPIDTIQCAVEYTPIGEKTVKRAALLAYTAKSKTVYFTHTFTAEELTGKRAVEQPGERVRQRYQQEDEKLLNFLSHMEMAPVSFQIRCLLEQSRSTTLNFAREIHADLLVFSGEADRMSLWSRFSPQDLEVALQHLPCSVLIVR